MASKIVFIIAGLLHLFGLTGSPLPNQPPFSPDSSPGVSNPKAGVYVSTSQDAPISMSRQTAQPSVMDVPASGAAAGGSLETFSNWVEITDDGTNVRTAPGVNEPSILRANKGNMFPVVTSEGQWLKVNLGAKQIGWVASWVVHTDHTAPLVSLGRVNDNNTVLRDGPGKEYRVMETVPVKTLLQPLIVAGDWLQVVDLQGRSGWIPVSSYQWERQGPAGTGSYVPTSNNIKNSIQRENWLAGKTIVIDPGHGGNDTGAIGTDPAVYERDVNLAVAEVLNEKLQAAGAHVIMTRTNNSDFVSLEQRVAISNRSGADLFVSIHQNMCPDDSSVGGVITYFYQSGPSETAARDIEKSTQQELHVSSPSGQADTQQQELYVLHHNTRPSVLIEGCFLSNPKELATSTTPDFQEQLSEGIFKGIRQYFGK